MVMTIERLPRTRNAPCDACDTRTPAVWQINLRIVYIQLCDGHLRRLVALATEALMQGEEETP